MSSCDRSAIDSVASARDGKMASKLMTDQQQTSSPTPEKAKPRHEPSVRDIVELARSQPAPARGAWACSLTTMLLLWASFTPLNYGWLAWLSLVPMLQLVRIERKTRWMYRSLFVSGLVWSVFTLQWMRLGDPAMVPAWGALSLYLAFYFPVFIAAARTAVLRFGIPMVVAVPLVWVGLEYLRATLMTGFAWYFLAHTQWAWTELIQISDVTGAYGVSFLVAASAACVAGLVPLKWLEKLKLFPPVQVPKEFEHLPAEGILAENSSRAEFKRPWLHIGFSVALVAVALSYGFVRRGQAEFKDGPRIALVQGHFPSSMKHDGTEWEKIFMIHDGLTGQAVKHQPDLVVWPETMYREPLQVLDEGVSETDLLRMAPPVRSQSRWLESWESHHVPDHFRKMAEMANAGLVIGVDTWHATKDGLNRYNSAAFISPQTGLTDRYDKMHRVLFGEYIPLKKEMPWLRKLTPFPEHYGIQKGESAKLFRHGKWTFAPIICFEDTVPQLVREISNGADESIDVFVNLTNDGWFADSSEQDQHLITATFRAIETRTPMVRAVNTGVSAIIDGDGIVLEPDQFLIFDEEHRRMENGSMRDPETGEWRKNIHATLVMDVPLDNRTSFYARNGDWFGMSCCFGAVFFFVAGMFSRKPTQARANGPNFDSGN